MKLENQVVSLELAKKLKELDFKQESLYYWAEDENFIVTKDKIENSQDWRDNYFIPAYTGAEFDEILPDILSRFCKDYYLSSYRYEGVSYCKYEDERGEDNIIKKSDTKVNAKAKMAIYLKENKII